LNWQGDLSTFGAYVSRQANFLIDDVGALTNANTEILTVDENLVLEFDKTSAGSSSFGGWSDIVVFAIEHGETGDRYVAITNENIWGGTVGLSTLYGTVAVIDVSDEYVEVTAHELGHTWGTLDEYNYIAWQEERDWVLRNMPPSTAYNSYPVDDDPKMPYPPPDYDYPTCKGRSFGFLGLGRCTMGPAFSSWWPNYRGFCPECQPIVDDHIFASWGYWSWGLAEVVVTFFKNGAAPEVERITGIPVAGKSMHWAGFGNYGVQVFSEAGGLLYNSNISYSFLLAPSQTEDGTAMPTETDAITVAWLVPAFSERKITVVLRDNIADQIITSQEVVLAPIDEAWIDYKTTDRTTYDFGDTIEVTTEVETTTTSIDIILDVTLLDPNNVAQDYRSWTGTIHPGPDPIARYLTIPSSGITGTWTVYVVVLNSTGHFQDSESNFITVGIPADTTPPTTTLTISYPQYTDVAGNMHITSSTSSTLMAADDPGGSGVASTAYRIRNATYDSGWAASAPPVEFYLTGLADGSYFIDYNSTDNAGNVESTQTNSINLDNSGPLIIVENPPAGWALQDGVTFIASASDSSGTHGLNFSIREANGDQGIPVGFEDIPATYDAPTGRWNWYFNTLQLPDGHYMVLVNAEDNLGHAASITVPYSIRNWAVLECLPSTPNSKAGRTMPVKFSLRVAASVDPTQPFVYNEELTIKVYATDNPSNILQTSTFGVTSRDYRIDIPGEKYITNFKTLRTPKTYMVEIWRKDMLIGSFTFETVK